MNVQERTTIQAPGTAINTEGDLTSQPRQPWQTPTVTHLEIKRTMNSSGVITDGITSATV